MTEIEKILDGTFGKMPYIDVTFIDGSTIRGFVQNMNLNTTPITFTFQKQEVPRGQDGKFRIDIKNIKSITTFPFQEDEKRYDF